MSKRILDLDNQYFITKLLQEENITVIEEILEKEIKKFERLKNLKEQGKLDFGEKFDLERIVEDIFPKVAKKVNEFLEVDNIKLPKVKYFSIIKPGLLESVFLALCFSCGFYIVSDINNLLKWKDSEYVLDLSIQVMSLYLLSKFYNNIKSSSYNKLEKKITLEKEEYTKIVTVLAHEYTHHIQNNKLRDHFKKVMPTKYIAFLEGHARGVERFIAKEYSENENNYAFWYNVLDRVVGELKCVYKWLCINFEKEPKEILLNTETSIDERLDFRLKRHKKPSYHAIGNSLFLIYELKHGNDVYKKIIKGDLEFLESD
ncbi:MAG: hypothetical protein QXU20_00045 [Candidatus Woesearchaeota archaeon]